MLIKRGAELQTTHDPRLSSLESSEEDQIEARLGSLSAQDLEDFSKTDWLIICFIVILLISMVFCCACMLCKKTSEQGARNLDDLPTLHEPDQMETHGDDWGQPELIAPGTPPPAFGNFSEKDALNISLIRKNNSCPTSSQTKSFRKSDTT
ncbi:unnamed protein product [Oikopleura dioica]|uniref:Uncharacterized protein n=1 Tax=Oikopleura dioica TaxID=34765 RepID=E4WVZ8_OIKDI|nr:unnamed protein product [Oikopleura dioica]CBY31724.1 unnamed protein product [Oikopleura dioica]